MLWSSVNYFAIFCSILTFSWWGALSASKSEGKSSIFPQTKTKLLSGASSALKMTTLLCFCSVLFYYVLLQQRRNAQCCCFPACSPFLTSSIFVFPDHLSKTLAASGKGVTSWQYPRKWFLLSFPHFIVTSARCDGGQLLPQWEWRFHWLHRGQIFTLGDLLEKWEGISIFTENLPPLIVLKPQIFSSQGKVHLISDGCSGWASSAAGNLGKLLKTPTGIKEKQGGKGLFAIKHQHKPSWAFCLCPSPSLFTHSSSPSSQSQNANFSNHCRMKTIIEINENIILNLV